MEHVGWGGRFAALLGPGAAEELLPPRPRKACDRSRDNPDKCTISVIAARTVSHDASVCNKELFRVPE